MEPIKFITFAGAHVYGISYVGAYRALYERGLINDITHWTGSSAGSMASVFGAMCPPCEVLESILIETDFNKFLDTPINKSTLLNPFNIMNLLSTLGHSKGNYFVSWIQNHLEKLGYNRDITFSEFYNLTGKHITVTTTSVNTNETLYLSRSSYPDIKIADALHASIILPFIFQPIVMSDPLYCKDKRLLADGGIYDNYPLYASDAMDDMGNYYAINKKSIGIFVHHSGRWVDPYVEINGIIPYMSILYKGLFNYLMLENTRRPYFWERSVALDMGDIKIDNFNVEHYQKTQMIEIGYQTTKNFLDKRLCCSNKISPSSDIIGEMEKNKYNNQDSTFRSTNKGLGFERREYSYDDSSYSNYSEQYQNGPVMKDICNRKNVLMNTFPTRRTNQNSTLILESPDSYNINWLNKGNLQSESCEKYRNVGQDGVGEMVDDYNLQEFLSLTAEKNNLYEDLTDFQYDYYNDLFLRLDGRWISEYEQQSYLGDTLIYNTNQCRRNFGGFISNRIIPHNNN